MSNAKPAEITAQIVDLLGPLESTDRVNVVRAAMILLGEDAGSSKASVSQDELREPAGEFGSLPQKAQIWVKQNGLTIHQLQQVFHLGEGTAEVIAADIPGNGKKEKTLNAYILTGLSNLLSAGTPTFDDKTARAICTNSGCYDKSNHSAYMKDKGNIFTGTKDGGWTLTAPGLKAGADLVKGLG